MLHLALAGAFLVLALVHSVTWAAVRTQRVQLWLASSFLGFAVLTFTIGLTSREASAMIADTRPWLILGVLPSIPLPYTLLRVVWSLLDLPLTLWRRVMLGVALAFGTVRVVDVSWSVLSLPAAGLTSEQLTHATAGLSLPLFWLLATCVAGTWAVEAARLLKRRGAMAVAVLAAALVALVLLSRELAIDAGWLPGPSLFALVGLPFLLFASTALAILTARSLRGADLGTGIHRYRRLTRLGRGGMGEVWLAVRTGRAGFHRLVVLKRMLDEKHEEPEVMLHRFIGEARTAARLHHPNIVSVYDLGQIDGGWFIVMEYLSGVNVLELVRRVQKGGTLPLEVIVELCQQALRGLDYAHEHGVIHRDISADNLVVSFDGVVKVVDFGIAHGSGEAQERVTPSAASLPTTRLTQVGGIIGKVPYMPPERLEGAEATISGDLFALGCVLHELLFGRLPDLSTGRLQLPQGERPDAPAAYALLRNVLATALHPAQARRYADARAFQRGLEPVRQALPAAELTGWLRENFAERWTRERQLSELGDPTPAEVEALLTRELAAAPGVDSGTTRIIGAKAAPPIEEQTTRLIQRPR
ncbi:serine/threonine-protein kinase [Archangium gephyra]|uniref:Serine/threonine protein kinase PrkC, regulator of stationary phase n=2 Tax=Archangium gephyra TaxID=48 RepID=A0AAC8QDW4_9BACT|nr:Serine/threonine protein kinase PrkC, regulator of stationary phase [Archangium gephyra]REG27300.1 serine/threonine-protein kinase [Archangium gephyra]